MRIGDVALDAVDGDRARQRAAPSDLHRVAEAVRVGRLAQDALREGLAALPGPVEELRRAVDRRPFLVARDQEGEGAVGPPVEVAQGRGDRRRYAALHVDRAAPIERVTDDRAGERAVGPALLVAWRHHVDMAGEDEGGSGGPDAGVEVLDVGRAVLAEHGPVDLKSRRLERRLDDAERTGRVRRHGSAADQRLGQGDGVAWVEAEGVHGLALQRKAWVTSIPSKMRTIMLTTMVAMAAWNRIATTRSAIQ